MLATLITCTLDTGQAAALGLWRSIVAVFSVMVMVVIVVVVDDTPRTAIHDASLALRSAV